MKYYRNTDPQKVLHSCLLVTINRHDCVISPDSQSPKPEKKKGML
uniref:Uncharacterized protein n=1 Tax=Rhizophora mucronata TaxID=61149 RepID=A0A2P2NDM5_RHIMU